MKAVLLPVDQVTENANCFSVQTPSHRRELIQGYVRRLDESVSIKFSSAELKRDPCRLKVDREKKSVKDNVSASAFHTVEVSQSQTTATTVESMNIQTLSHFELQYNQSVITGKCRYITPDKYEVSLEARKDPKPLLPPVPPGTNVWIQNPPRPADQETSVLKTELQLSRGERIEIGSVLKKDDGKDHTVSIDPQAEVNKTWGEQLEKVYLSLE